MNTGVILLLGGIGILVGSVMLCGLEVTLAVVAAGPLITAGFVLMNGWPAGALCGVIAALWAWAWWNGPRRKRRSVLREFGAKARVRIAAMKSKLKERARPRRVLRPVPGNVG